jgi:RimJ/RimL family protein N-acetyltransferase
VHTILETPRLRLRPFTIRDLDPLAAMVADREQMRYYPRPKTRAEASAWINRNLSLYEEHGLGFWFIESIATAEFLGYCGIRPQPINGVDETEIGWHTRKRFWNKGVATEAALACRNLAFARFGLQRLMGLIDPRNLASLRVAAKIGMQPEREVLLDDYPCVVHVVERHAPPRAATDRGEPSFFP